MQAEFWGILHDGGINHIDGVVPGTVAIDISILYLRQQFPGEGSGFKVILENCTRFECAEYDSSPVYDFATIVALDPEILELEQAADPTVVNCTMGTLTLSYASAAVYLDSGTPVSFDELAAASTAYWNAWQAGIERDK